MMTSIEYNTSNVAIMGIQRPLAFSYFFQSEVSVRGWGHSDVSYLGECTLL